MKKENEGMLNPNATVKERLSDYFGRYTIILNGTVCEKRVNQPQELTQENKKRVIVQIFSLFREMLPKEKLTDESQLGSILYNKGFNACREEIKNKWIEEE